MVKTIRQDKTEGDNLPSFELQPSGNRAAIESLSESARETYSRYSGVDSLTVRELEVLQETANGLTYFEIGAKLFLSPETVKTYRKQICRKLQAKNGAEAVAIGFRNRVIE